MKADEPMKKKVGHGAASQINKGKIKRAFKDERHIRTRRRRHKD